MARRALADLPHGRLPALVTGTMRFDEAQPAAALLWPGGRLTAGTGLVLSSRHAGRPQLFSQHGGDCGDGRLF